MSLPSGNRSSLCKTEFVLASIRSAHGASDYRNRPYSDGGNDTTYKNTRICDNSRGFDTFWPRYRLLSLIGSESREDREERNRVLATFPVTNNDERHEALLNAWEPGFGASSGCLGRFHIFHREKRKRDARCGQGFARSHSLVAQYVQQHAVADPHQTMVDVYGCEAWAHRTTCCNDSAAFTTLATSCL